ncbi:hypothetical protein [Adhaeribacter radiodurans]|uniref:Uncharacterized protein n=1 Tax=Adhaeribacter radiodurans TaxID=2745197 RepID=A0A7L7LEK1_9BACT|nr:hypothetical protein [Adhaeribacter radiodurans]QMU31104.1 hypothetical protein HUW48_25130 [Adhaeribacter radiodurans]
MAGGPRLDPSAYGTSPKNMGEDAVIPNFSFPPPVGIWLRTGTLKRPQQPNWCLLPVATALTFSNYLVFSIVHQATSTSLFLGKVPIEQKGLIEINFFFRIF